MKHCIRLLIITWLIASASTLSAQSRLRPYIQKAPDFTEEERELIVNVLDSLPKVKPPHRIYQDLELLHADSTSLTIRTTALSLWSMNLLRRSDGTPLIITINTVERPVADSRIEAFGQDWERMNLKGLLPAPTRDDFVRSLPKGERAGIAKLLYPLALTYSWAPSGALRARPSIPELVEPNTDTYRTIANLPPITYHWDGQQFIKQ